jgi:hypothetical protein
MKPPPIRDQSESSQISQSQDFFSKLLERFPITWNHVIEEESLNINKLEHVPIEKVEQLFRDML